MISPFSSWEIYSIEKWRNVHNVTLLPSAFDSRVHLIQAEHIIDSS